MPCYTVQTATVLFGKNTDVTLLQKALQDSGIDTSLYSEIITSGDSVILGYGIQFNRKSGVLTVRGQSFDESKIGQVKRLYSEQVLEHTAKRNGWRLTWSTNAAGNRVAQTERQSR